MSPSLKQLLVHLDATDASARRLAAAFRIADAHDAAVGALYAVTPALVTVPFAAEAGAAIASTLQGMDDGRRDAARKAFEHAQANARSAASWAEISDFPIIGAFIRQALYADLLVLGQHHASDAGAASVPADFVESVIVGSGKPALVMPYQSAQPTAGENIVIGWKPTREAARAVSAALPLLGQARSVHVLSWAVDEDEVIGARLDLDTFFQLHGIVSTWHREGGGEPDSLGELLLSRACDLGADMLVMGCYGHSRAREWLLGGTSRAVLRSMTLPVLMAH